MECYFAKQKFNDAFILDLEDSKHLIMVLRHQLNDEIVIIYEQQKYLTNIITIKPVVKCKIIKLLANHNYELPCKITLVMALLKEQKFDWIIQKAVELGVYQIVPIQLKRCVSVLNFQKAQQKVSRWQKIAKAAAQQANRNLVPIINPVVFNINDLKQYQSTLNLVADENSQNLAWTNDINDQLTTLTILIGPEGGISTNEIMTLKTLGFTNISLGKLILRAETAPLFLIAIINYQTNLLVKGAKDG